MPARHLQGPPDGVERRFQLHDQYPGFGNGWPGRIDHLGRQPRIGAGRDDDHVLAVLGDENIGDTRGDAVERRDMGRIDPVGHQIGYRLAGKAVVADGSDHARHGAQPGAGHRLVQSLAADGHGHVAAGDRLVRLRQAGDPQNEIDIGAAGDDDRHARLPL